MKDNVKRIDSPHVQFIQQFSSISNGWDFVTSNNLEGLVIKSRDTRYEFEDIGNLLNVEHRVREWFKIKNLKEGRERVIGYERGSVKGALLLENGGKVSALVNGVGQLYEMNKELGVFAEFMYLFKTPKGIAFQGRLKRLVLEDGTILWEAGG